MLLLASVCIVSCDPNSNDNNPNNGDFAENFGNSAARDFIGRVVDTDNHAIQNVTVKIGNSTVQTDVNGVFIINGADVHEKFAYITATKSGFMDGSRSMVPTTGKNNVAIMLVPSTPVGSVNSGASAEVALPSGSKVVFDGSFKDENGNAYSGAVSVAMYHLKPSDTNISNIMPGMLYAEDENGDEAGLSTFGMLNVELRGSGGQKLNIAEGHTAEITMMIDASQVATAPATIPLWHFDEVNGYWKQDGTATKQGNKYVGQVSHFSWWNCDTFSSVVNLTVTVVNPAGAPIGNVGVGLVVASTNFNSYVQYTSDNGQISGQVPANQALTMNLYDACGNIVYTASIGPFSADTSLPSVTLTPSMITTTQVEGTLLQCGGGNVVNGYVLFEYGNQSLLSPVSNGAFSFNTLVCGASESSFTLEGFDYANLQTTGSIGYTFTSPVTNIGNISACNTVSEFISYQIDSNPGVYIISSITATSGANGTTGGLSISGYTSDQTGGIYIWGDTNIPGIYTSSQFSIEGTNVGFIGSGTVNDVVFTLSNYGGPGDYIDLTFNGTYVDSATTHTINGVAHVIRDN